MESDIRTLSLGGGMTEDIEHMAEISSESMRLDRLVKKADDLIRSIENEEVAAIWNSFDSAQKKAAVFMAEKQRKDVR